MTGTLPSGIQGKALGILEAHRFSRQSAAQACSHAQGLGPGPPLPWQATACSTCAAPLALLDTGKAAHHIRRRQRTSPLPARRAGRPRGTAPPSRVQDLPDWVWRPAPAGRAAPGTPPARSWQRLWIRWSRGRRRSRVVGRSRQGGPRPLRLDTLALRRQAFPLRARPSAGTVYTPPIPTAAAWQVSAEAHGRLRARAKLWSQTSEPKHPTSSATAACNMRAGRQELQNFVGQPQHCAGTPSCPARRCAPADLQSQSLAGRKAGVGPWAHPPWPGMLLAGQVGRWKHQLPAWGTPCGAAHHGRRAHAQACLQLAQARQCGRGGAVGGCGGIAGLRGDLSHGRRQLRGACIAPVPSVGTSRDGLRLLE